ncbi:DUF4241 domain-containing protein [Bradyrhizobium sp. 26S5]|uniref:DUF4241 domain-containing protein n=1 Tax=Bradyrhizobium sp. 26S5 TaxID=3139729 RepID=UPI0030D3268E
MKEVDLGSVYFPTGRVCCCDPFLSADVAPFNYTIAPGHYPVRITRTHVGDWGWRNAAASMVIADVLPDNSICATYLRDNESVSGFRVESGLACFMDESTREFFSRIVAEFHNRDAKANYYDDVLAAEFARNADADERDQLGSWNIHFPLEGDPRNIAMFASGLGDGQYSAEWMLKNDVLCKLVADFKILENDVAV